MMWGTGYVKQLHGLPAKDALLLTCDDHVIVELIDELVARRPYLLPAPETSPRELHPGDAVIIGRGVDGTIPYHAIGQRGIVRGIRAEGICGETQNDPCYLVEFGAGAQDIFWREELS